MKAIRVRDTLIVLDNITRVTFEANDESITADNSCNIYFVGGGNDPLVFRGADAQVVFDRISADMGAE